MYSDWNSSFFPQPCTNNVRKSFGRRLSQRSISVKLLMILTVGAHDVWLHYEQSGVCTAEDDQIFSILFIVNLGTVIGTSTHKSKTFRIIIHRTVYTCIVWAWFPWFPCESEREIRNFVFRVFLKYSFKFNLEIQILRTYSWAGSKPRSWNWFLSPMLPTPSTHELFVMNIWWNQCRQRTNVSLVLVNLQQQCASTWKVDYQLLRMRPTSKKEKLCFKTTYFPCGRSSTTVWPAPFFLNKDISIIRMWLCPAPSLCSASPVMTMFMASGSVLNRSANALCIGRMGILQLSHNVTISKWTLLDFVT